MMSSREQERADLCAIRCLKASLNRIRYVIGRGSRAR
jgi:hypothetical protein